jgi:acetyl-CoA carboxylase carboxyl transferase subunit beta
MSTGSSSDAHPTTSPLAASSDSVNRSTKIDVPGGSNTNQPFPDSLASFPASESKRESRDIDHDSTTGKKRGVPEGLWIKCPDCSSPLYKKEVVKRLNVCPKCDHHFYVSARQRIEQVLDDGTFEEMNDHLRSTDPLAFKDRRQYADRLVDEQERTGLTDAVVTGTGMIRARRVAFAVTDSAFIMGSMGSVVGERLARLIEHATTHNLPLIIISASGGGARMHEGILSLMQMAKVSAALARYDECDGLFISVLTNPTMGGVAASFASLGDLVLAEPRALIGFAGPRTIKATIGIELPEGFQTSEFLLEHGYIDRIVTRENLKSEIARVIDYCGK